MSLDAGNGTTRVDLLRGTVGTFIDVMQQGDGLGIVRFDNLVDTLMPVTDVGQCPAPQPLKHNPFCPNAVVVVLAQTAIQGRAHAWP
jgi:hypothetical protein